MYLFSLEKNQTTAEFAKKQTNTVFSYYYQINFFVPFPSHFFSIKYDQKLPTLKKKTSET